MQSHKYRQKLGFYIPSSFCADAYGCCHADGARYVMSVVVRGSVTTDQGDAPVYSGCLRSIVGANYKKRLITPMMNDESLVHSRASSRERHESNAYALGARFDNDAIHYSPAINPKIRQNLSDFYRRRRAEAEATWLPVHHALAGLQSSLRIEVAEAKRIVGTMSPRQDKNGRDKKINRIGHLSLIERIDRQDNLFSVGRTGRVFTSFTCLRREIRSTLRSQGERLRGIDIVASQPI